MIMANEVPQFTLNSGVEIPALGFGAYQIPAGQTEEAVTQALAAGYRSVDTAAAYENEEAVGRAIASIAQSSSRRSYSRSPAASRASA